jgi:hypothetical protein
VVAGRLTRGAKDGGSTSGDTDSTPLYDEVRGTASGSPTAGTAYPETPPAYPAGSAVGEPGTTMEQNVTDAPWVDEPGRRGTA